MTFANVEYNRDQYLNNLQSLSVDDQLAVLWYAYEAIGDSITPGGPKAAGFEIAQGLVDRMKNMSEEDQLQVQRDVAGRADTTVSREYGSASPSTKLAFWYLTAKETAAGNLVQVPADYQIADNAQEFLNQLKGLNFEQQIDLIKEAVIPMGIADSVTPQMV
jgi:hypothetical protein